MGLDINAVQFLVAAKTRGANFDRTATIGRQGLGVFPRKVRTILEKNSLSAGAFAAAGPECVFAEPLFAALGARQVDAMDNSDFEGAKLLHDLNQPIPPEWKAQYDAVIDGGTLEHVFNFPVALRNVMEMVRPGGRLFIHNIANNFCGHGFYQFSPELFYRTLSPENGFCVERMILHRIGPYGAWWEVADPNVIHQRTELFTFTPMNILVQARRTEVKEIFAVTPQQSDYSALWALGKRKTGPFANPLFAGPARLFSALKTGMDFWRRQSLGNRKFFKKVPRE
jgi:SAM-dependent methyltransferase